VIPIGCLLFPIMSGCSAYTQYVPAIPAVIHRRSFYTGKTIVVTGQVERLDQWRARGGFEQETFYVCDGPCIHVYMEARSPIHDGQRVAVRGTYYQAYHSAGHKTYYNEIEATDVTLRD
jgi:hypothetical protein